MSTLIKNADIVTGQGVLNSMDLLLEEGIIKAIGRFSPAEGIDMLDAQDHYVVPGFIDCHIHGFAGYDVNGSAEDLERMALKLAQRGVTGFFATLSPETDEEYERIFDEYRKAFDGSCCGARFLGLHMEGPFVSPGKKGAIPEHMIRKNDVRGLKQLLEAGKGLIRLMTIAPELEGSREAFELLKQCGVVISMGHSNALYRHAVDGIRWGASQATHTYNAMRGFSHREPGILDAVLLHDELYAEIILDCVHVSEEAVRLLLKAKGPERVIGISDGWKMCGMACDTFRANGLIIKDGAVFMEDGTLYAGMKDMADHFKILVERIGVSIPDAVRITATNCASNMGIKGGSIRVGYPADLNILNRKLSVTRTFVGGMPVSGPFESDQ